MSQIDKIFLPVRHVSTPEEQLEKLKKVGSMYEKQFLREMMKAMRASVSESNLIPKSQAEKIFQEQMDDQIVEKWGDNGGLGLGKMITDRLVDEYGKKLGIKKYQGQE